MKTLTFMGWIMGLALASGCTAQGALEADLPLDVAVICPVGSHGNRFSCDAPARGRLFDQWGDVALTRPGSRFRVLTVGTDRRSYTSRFTTCVPLRWGPGVQAAKNSFKEAGRAGATSSEPDSPHEVTCEPEEGPSTAAKAEPKALLIQVDGRVVELPRPSGTPLQWAIVCDRSNSTLGTSCRWEDIRDDLSQWLLAGGSTPGSSIEIIQPGDSRDTAKRVFLLQVPDLPLGERVAYVLGAFNELPAWGDEEAGHSAIAEALDVAGESMRARTGTRKIILRSDLRQVSSGLNFESQVPDEREFQRYLERERLLRNIEGTSILVCGTHHQRGPGAGPFTGRAAEQLVRTWQAAFVQAGLGQVQIPGSCSEGKE